MHSAVLVLCLAIILSGCSTPAIVLDIRADQMLNQDQQGYNYSVLVRLYQLKSLEQFGKADYQLLLERNPAALGDSLVSYEEFIVEPGEAYRLEFLREDGAEYQGLVAFFRSVEGEQWRLTGYLQNGLLSPMTTEFDVRLKDSGIYLIGQY
ncbi:MAG: type VI secretion system lipoprotein TssJ [Natronospirillum sp.]